MSFGTLIEMNGVCCCFIATIDSKQVNLITRFIITQVFFSNVKLHYYVQYIFYVPISYAQPDSSSLYKYCSYARVFNAGSSKQLVSPHTELVIDKITKRLLLRQTKTIIIISYLAAETIEDTT